MSDPWASEGQLSAITSRCNCYGRLGCGHDVPLVQSRLSPLQGDFDVRLLEVGGLDLSIVTYEQPDLPLLPRIIPAVDGGVAAQAVRRPWVAVLLKDWLAAEASKDFESPQHWLGLPDDVKVMLTLFASDRDLERLWRERRDFVRGLDRFAPSAVVAPSFSTWDGDLWMEHRYQLQRSFDILRMLRDHGHATIPHATWGRRADADDLAHWLNDNHVGVIAVDAQCLGRRFRGWLGQLDWFREQLIERPTLIVGGLRAADRLTALNDVWPDSRAIYNGLRLAGSHRELRVMLDGAIRPVRHAFASNMQRPSLWDSDEEDPSPGMLYLRSIRTLESTLPPLEIQPLPDLPDKRTARRIDDAVALTTSRIGSARR